MLVWFMSIFLSVALETEEQTTSHDHLDSCCAVAVARLVMIDLCAWWKVSGIECTPAARSAFSLWRADDYRISLFMILNSQFNWKVRGVGRLHCRVGDGVFASRRRLRRLG